MKSNKPIFRGLTQHSSTQAAYCPKCDKIITHFNQEQCEHCGQKLDWEGVYGVMYKVFTKDEVVDMLTELQLEIEELKPNNPNFKGYYEQKVALNKVSNIIQQKINALKGADNENYK